MNVSYDQRALTIDGKRTFLLSGAIHYPRSTPEMWPALMKRSREAGLNAIETYVFWNLHERERGIYDFSGRLDLEYFCRCAQAAGLHVILRIGPYICAETNYGGLPAWLRDVPGIVMRTENKPFMREMERWVRDLTDRLRPLFAPAGGPIIAAQIENEYGMVARHYGAAGQRYLRWSIELAQSLELGVPWIMCFGGMPGALETINAFYGHELIDQHRITNPAQPLLWTEDWSGWYDTWGVAHHVRAAADEAYAVLRFIAAGGTGVNYYMWHGGTNFGREAMYLQTTSYDYDAPLNEIGEHTPKALLLADMHRALKPYTALLLASAGPAVKRLGRQAAAYVYAGAKRELAFVCNDGGKAIQASYAGRTLTLPARSAVLIGDGTTVFCSHATTTKRAPAPRAKRAVELRNWRTWPEPLPQDRSDPGTPARQPIEQLKLTRDRTDYCWYSSTLSVSPAEARRTGRLTLSRIADVAYVYVDGALAAHTPGPLLEERGDIRGDGFRQDFSLRLPPGRHRLDILCAAIGLIKGDWQLGGRNMVEERKGLSGPVCWNDKPVGGWTMRPGLAGERQFGLAVAQTEPGANAAPAEPWARLTPFLRWYSADFDLAGSLSPLMLGLHGLTKGMAWVNRRCLGRYWMIPGVGLESDFIRNSPLHSIHPGAPAQTEWHVPAAWLGRHNTLTLLEELSGDPAGVTLRA